MCRFLIRTSETDDLHKALSSQELSGWYGKEVTDWKHLRTYDIPAALPDQSTPAFDHLDASTLLRDNVSVCGDYRINGSINGAMESGRLAAAGAASKTWMISHSLDLEAGINAVIQSSH